MKNLGEANIILSIKIYRDRSKRLIKLNQSAYMDKLLKRYRMDNSKRGYIPMQERLDLNKTQGASTPGENSGKSHWTVVKTILKYLRNTKDMLLVYGRNTKAELRVVCYCNAGFETDSDEIKSQTGYVFIVNGRRSRLEKLQVKYYSTLLIANELGVQMGAEHYHRRYHYVCKCIELGEINLLKVHTDNNLADLFTKTLSNEKLTQHVRSMGLRLASSFM
nr:hypothetical protein [Tanacetum cinerariifolium]